MTGRARRVAVGALCAVAVTVLGTPVAGATPKVPFSDPNADGYIGLCDRAGTQVTSGSIDATPFAWRAVSSVAAPKPYDNDDRTAVLLAYQPRVGLPSEEWSGQEMTASARYSNPAHPMAAATGADYSLEDFLSNYHAVWNGFVELRMYLGTADEPVYSYRYPVLDIHVTGSTWHAIGGGPVDCRSGEAESIESIVLPKSDTTSPTSTPPTTAGGAPPRPGSHTGGHGSNTSPETTSPRSLAAATGPSSHLPLVLAVVFAALLCAAASMLVFRRRRSPTPSPAADHRRADHQKGRSS